MQIKSALFIVSMALASQAAADARVDASSQYPEGLNGFVFAQVQIGDISESDMRRLVFYAERATRTLHDLVEGADGRSVRDQGKVNARFRESISRMADAGARTGLSMDQVADFYTQHVFDTYGQGFIQKLSVFAGGLDFRTLFRNSTPVQETVEDLDENGLMNALANASQGLDLQNSTTEGSAPVEVVTAEPEGPIPLPNANAVEVSIVDRVKVVGGRWELTVISGDSLSSIASAIYGDALAYTTIQSANAASVPNANVIEVGTVLTLPKP